MTKMKIMSAKELSILNQLDREIAQNLSAIKNVVRVTSPKVVSGELYSIFSIKELADLIVLAAVTTKIQSRDPKRVEDIIKLFKVGS